MLYYTIYQYFLGKTLLTFQARPSQFSSSNEQLNHNSRKRKCIHNIRNLENKVKQAISTLTEVSEDLQELHALMSSPNPFEHNQTIALSQLGSSYVPESLSSLLFADDTEGVTVVELVQNEDTRDKCKCSVCDKTCENPLKLRNHLRTHRQTKKYFCEICHLGFPVPSKLKEHMRTHTGERPFMCEICKKCFTKSSSLKRHKQLHINFQPSILPYPILQDQVVQSGDRVLSPAFKMEQESSCITFNGNFLPHTESEISSAPVSP